MEYEGNTETYQCPFWRDWHGPDLLRYRVEVRIPQSTGITLDYLRNTHWPSELGLPPIQDAYIEPTFHFEESKVKENGIWRARSKRVVNPNTLGRWYIVLSVENEEQARALPTRMMVTGNYIYLNHFYGTT